MYICKTIQWIDDAALLRWMGGSIMASLVKVTERNGQRFCHLTPVAQHFGSVSVYTPWCRDFWSAPCGESVWLCVTPRAASGLPEQPCAALAGSAASVLPREQPGGSSPGGAAQGEQPGGSSPVPGHRCQQQQAPARWGALSSFVLKGLFRPTGASCWVSLETVPSFCKRQQDKHFKMI